MAEKSEEKITTGLRVDPIERVDLKPARAEPPRAGSLCPECGRGRLDYDGLLVLRCPVCDFSEGGCFT